MLLMLLLLLLLLCSPDHAPTAKKPKEDLDAKYILGPGHEEPPQQLVNRRVGIRRLQPLEIFNTVVKHNLNSLTKLSSGKEKYGKI